MASAKTASTVLICSIIVFLLPGRLSAVQDRGGRVGIPASPKPATTRSSGGSSKDSGTRKPARPPTTSSPLPAVLIVSVTPSDAHVRLNDQETNYRELDGSLRFRDLKPGSFTIVAQRPAYRDYIRTINLEPNQREVISIALTPLAGRVSVAPNVDGALITLTNKENNATVGSYTGKVNDLEVAAGTYQVSVRLTGYDVLTRDVEVKPAETVYLEPQLRLLPVETPLVRRIAAMRLQTSTESKNVVVSLTGASGETSSRSGTIEVRLDGRSGGGTVLGALPGIPCKMDFVRLENIGEYSFTEAPAASNGWSRIGVRIRAKDSKRPVHFAINWSSVESSRMSGGDITTASLTEEAVPFQKILPNYPPAARASRIAGTVFVRVEIDEQGNVVSAKAIDGPGVLGSAAENAARQWKFHPAKRAGKPARAIQTIQFNFNPQF